MRFDVSPELRLFGDSVRAAVGDWEPVREPEPASWFDDRDDELASRLAAVGWHELWADDDFGAVVAGGLEIGRAIAPICLVDEATLGAPLAVDGRIRHGLETETCAVPTAGWNLMLASPTGARRRRATLDGTGTMVASIENANALAPHDADERWSAWTAATLAYVAGLAAAALDATLAHARSREQFGRTLSAMPAVQARLADTALLVDGLELSAWRAAMPAGFSRAPALLWGTSACRDVTASAHQVHGAIGFALETGLHRSYRRAKAVQVWATAVCRAATS